MEIYLIRFRPTRKAICARDIVCRKKTAQQFVLSRNGFCVYSSLSESAEST